MTSVNLTGYHLTFDAEMTSAADASLFSNTFINGDRTIYSNSEAERYQDYSPASSSPIGFSNGALTITASPQADGTYASGLLTTAQTFSQNTGYFEIRAQVPDTHGFWPAFWMLSDDYSSEVDIMEQPNNDGSNNYFNSVKTSGLNAGGFQNAGVDLGAGYHSYGFMWTPYTIQFTLDGQYVGYAVGTPSGLANAKLYLLANLAVGGYGSWPGQPQAGASATFSIDYIRAFSNDSSVPGVAQEAISSPDGVDTTPALLPALASVGTGSHALTLKFAEDAWQGDAQFTVSVDGVQQGGVMTASASMAFKQTQTLTINGDWSPGGHKVSVNFLNDAYGGSASADRNLYLTQVALDGAVIQDSARSLLSSGPQYVNFQGPGTPLPYAPTTVLSVGSGSPAQAAPVQSGRVDTLALAVAEDAWQGDAQFTVSVDGAQVGGVQTATASHGSGGSQVFDVQGTFAPGAHTVSVDFLNDAYGGSPSADRNFYVTGATIDGAAIPSGSLSEYSNGTQSFGFTEPSTDTLTLGVSEDAYQGDAQYRVLVDGAYVGGTYAATASHAAGQISTQTISGNWGPGPHAVGLQFINDAYGGLGADRNLYINSVSYDGAALPVGTIPQLSNGTSTVDIPAASTLTLHLSEDAWQGDAQFSLAVDGVQVAGPTTVGASHAAGASQAVALPVALTAGLHDVAISFLNDAYGGSSSTDRNLYVVGAELNGTPLSGTAWSAALLSNGTDHFALTVPS